MHKVAKKIAECLKAKVEAKGIDNIEGQDLVELGMWTDIIKDLVCYDKDMRIIEAMDKEENEYGEDWDEDGPIDEEKRYYRGQSRDSRGRYTSGSRSGRGRSRGRRNYEEPMMHMPDLERDMDYGMGRMYYTQFQGSNDSGNRMSTSQPSNGQSQSSRYGYSYDNYMEGRRNYSKTEPAHKQERMKMMEEYTKDLVESINQVMEDVSPEEKTMLRSKLAKVVNSMQ
jgi:hypothetical protein